MKWATIADRAQQIGVALFLIAIGALGDSLITQTGKINFWRARSNELYAIGTPTSTKVEKPGTVVVANSSQSPPHCTVPGKKGDVVIKITK